MNEKQKEEKIRVVKELEFPTDVEQLVKVLFALGMKEFNFGESKIEGDSCIVTLRTTWKFKTKVDVLGENRR